MLETNTAVFRIEDGVVVVRIRPDAYQSVADASENLAASMEMAGGQRRPLLADIRGAQPLDAEARHAYTGQKLVDSFTAIALLVDSSPLGVIMGNVYLRIARPGIPTRIFSDEAQAKAWLSTYR